MKPLQRFFFTRVLGMLVLGALLVTAVSVARAAGPETETAAPPRAAR